MPECEQRQNMPKNKLFANLRPRATSLRPVQSADTGNAETAVSTILESMNSALVRGHRIEIRGFGSFSVIYRASRMGRNPHSGAPVEIPAARVPHFKPGKALRETVDLPADEVAPAQSQAK
jgi:integration host factor subunit beta